MPLKNEHISSMRPSLVIAALVIATPVMAQSNMVSVKVDRVYSNGSYFHALLRVTNQTSQLINEAKVECDIFDGQKQALGIGKDFPEKIAAGQTVISEVLAKAPPDAPTSGLSAECRVISAK